MGVSIMAFMDLFRAKDNEMLRNRVAELEALCTPEMTELDSAKKHIAAATAELDAILKQTAEKSEELRKISAELEAARKNIVETNDLALYQSMGLYEPHFQFANSTLYKERLAKCRDAQKSAIKDGSAAYGGENWTVNGDSKKGGKMVADMKKLLIRAFNTECDDIIDHVKAGNIDSSEDRIRRSADALSKLGTILTVHISRSYVNFKIEELYLAHEYALAKQKEKEELRQLKAEERERAKVEKEIEEARKKLEKEQKHYSNALAAINKQLENARTADLPALQAKRAEIEESLASLGKSLEDIDYRAANQKAGYVYIISNIGAFGEGVYKIGMTRRLEPMDRVDELGDASVPFDFDVHALIFSDDAPALEAALHRAFEDRKLNMVNTRREFFRVPLEEIKRVVQENYDKTVEFVDVPPAEQYRESILIASGHKPIKH